MRFITPGELMIIGVYRGGQQWLGVLYADTDACTRRAVLYGLSDTPSGHGGGHTVRGFGERG